jgi:mannose-6-phosphate isomerase-like protein (cupin superfamily)
MPGLCKVRSANADRAASNETSASSRFFPSALQSDSEQPVLPPRHPAPLMSHDNHISLSDALALLPAPDGKRFAGVFAHGTLEVEIYAPRGTDPQQPHTRDEVYIVISGSGEFLNGDVRHPFAPGDFLFVPAGVVHRFERFSDDLVVWVIFYGPEGGER